MKKDLREKLFDAWVEGLGQDQAQALHKSNNGLDEYCDSFEKHINGLSNLQLIDLLDGVL